MTLEHGENTIVLKENIIHITLNGAFNEYGAKDVAQKTKEIIAALKQDRFLILANLLSLDGATPEAFYISNKFNRWLNNKNMIAKAIVITSETIKNIDQQWVPSKSVQNIEYFHNVDDALIWLKEQI
ncbi:hypothetical protein H4J58_04825 [Colwellia sp. MB3u-70]|uniref:STAS/SEC14 domain-containing protein n=1 Tax=unclassified Colwellia TaxID=196834 RepID=UPI0015F63CD0|nr:MULTISPECIES: hypothetical protein [unclassified Colwellia]MBA6290872.1 hypothetical protein [Colwellia sp. MB3u-8]MBA6306439.1 hypothetical protein [Colwellia sp. MB3u-70]